MRIVSVAPRRPGKRVPWTIIPIDARYTNAETVRILRLLRANA